MSSQTSTALIFILAGAMFISNPSRQDHYKAIENYFESKDLATAFAYSLAKLFGVDNKFRYNNFLLFSTVSYENRTISVGFFGNVKVLEASDQETKPQATEQKKSESAAAPNLAETQQPSNPPSEDNSQLPTTSQLEDTSGEIFQVSSNEHGAVLKSQKIKIYLGNDCSASSPQYGNGKWTWKQLLNSPTPDGKDQSMGYIELNNTTFHFNYQKNPFSDSRCSE